jgi:nitrite reductase/ring-hydroxylating ferredoxin subunit/uncharacterized membrane protein
VLDRAIERLAAASRLDPVAQRVSDAVSDALDGEVARSTLSGTASGHPLHPPMTDMAMGLLHSSTVLDLLPGTATRRAATTLLSAGLVLSVPTVLTGLHDWMDTTGETRRVGLGHAATNSLALTCYVLSLLIRARGGAVAPRVLSAVGYVATLVGGFLGGDLAYRRGVGVDHTTFEHGPADWAPALALDELPLHELRGAEVDGVTVALFRTDEGVFAVADRCSHLGGPLSEGHVHTDTGEIGCPWHHSMFRLEDGRVTRGPATAPQPSYQTRVVDGTVEVRARA